MVRNLMGLPSVEMHIIPSIYGPATVARSYTKMELSPPLPLNAIAAHGLIIQFNKATINSSNCLVGLAGAPLLYYGWCIRSQLIKLQTNILTTIGPGPAMSMTKKKRKRKKEKLSFKT